MPFVSLLLTPCLLLSPVRRQIRESNILHRYRIGQLIRDHNKLRQERWIFDMDELLENTEGGRRGAVRNGMANGVPASVKMKTIAAVECMSMLFPRQTPEQHQ